ncbi:MAG: NAD(P)/FAD-dependent oxidoreductase [Gammaproteobacteria bacterium]|nr:NAD(P)/FAD-dependent oxidoreductase [Gammaproteobacteria bacterium]MBT5725121.1 NAD(P)/FAD-dependent oxidoreductase [Gammaproteobacteria bacterium]MBT7879650.1 NAD(P)/FAD-dependent oxidoreductase [Gammaproteobacteria bacterium]
MQCKSQKFDVVIVGAGFAGMYMLHRLRKLGLSTVVFEAGDDVGGTWYWNRYPGARCDAESLAYSFSFSSELEQEWEWSERYAPQPEILEYARHVSRRFDLRKDIHFETRVMSAHYQDDSLNWQLETDKGDSVVASFCVMATGCLSVPQLPDIPGVQNFKGNLYQASKWPHEPVSFKNQKVGIIGTGSSGIQAIPVIAEEAEHLTVFQRTPNFSVPAKNEPLDQNWVDEFKKNYRAHRENHKHAIGSGFGDLKIEPIDEPMEPILRSQLSEDQATQILEDAWVTGGAKFMGAIGDQLMNEEANQFAKEFVHRKIHETVADKDTANLLCPTNHPIGTRRICVDIGYYETYNRENVTLVSVKDNPIEEITESGVMVNGELTALDTLVLATGFDAMTGALLNMDIRGKDGLALSEKWHAGPRSYLGIAVADFPNLFTITGPGSPSVLSNMMVSIEQHVDWMIDCLAHMKEQDLKVFEAQSQAEDQWVSHVNDVASMTLFPKGGSWYLGANVKGKPRIFMPYAAGVGVYREVCDQVTAKGYEGFTFH